MKRTTSVFLMFAGAATLGVGAHSCQTRYSNEAVWTRQRPVIERFVRDPAKKKLTYEQLRVTLGEIPESDRERRCKMELLFGETLAHGGQTEAAEKAIASRSYEPYAECKQTNVIAIEAQRGYNIAAALAILAGVTGLIASFFRKRENTPVD